MPLPAWIRALPKAEVHVHLEGCVPAATIGFDDPSRAGVPLDPSTGVPQFSGLAEFLSYLDRSCGLVTEGHQAESIAYALTERAAANGVLHTDVIFNPTHWPAWHDDLEAFVARLDAGLSAGEEDFGVTAALCLSLKRTQPPAESVELVDWLLSTRPRRIVALSVDGNEAAAGPTADRFAPLFARARAEGLRTCAHAGESSGPDGVRDVVERLHVERVDHGVRALEDPLLVAALARTGMPLDVCPTSNVRLGVAPSLADHPIEALRASGVRVSVNTDDPLIFGTTVAGELDLCAATFGWDREVVAQIARTSIESCFAPPERVKELLALLDAASRDDSPARRPSRVERGR
ncbi:MAG: adenosine deaminase [Acidimicrobiales bacterium]